MISTFQCLKDIIIASVLFLFYVILYYTTPDVRASVVPETHYYKQLQDSLFRSIMKPKISEPNDPTEWVYVCGRCPMNFQDKHTRDSHRERCQKPGQSDTAAKNQGAKFIYPPYHQFQTGSDET